LKWSDVDLDTKIIRITKSFNPKLRGIKSTKISDLRNGHISSDLENVLIELKNKRSNEEFVLPHLTGCPVVVNTSFNVRGEPITLTPEDSYRCFMRTEMDMLVIENYISYKNDQNLLRNSTDWKEEFKLD
jgi:hypothetical protein